MSALERQKSKHPKGMMLRGDSFWPDAEQDQASAKAKKPSSPKSSPKAASKKKADQAKQESSGSDTDSLCRVQSMIKSKNKPLIAARPEGYQKKYTAVLDLDETIVFSRDGPLMSRAFAKDFLRTLQKYFEVVVWTAGVRSYARAVIDEINFDNIIEHVVYRHRTWFNKKDYTKDLRLLGRDMNHVLIIENTPDCMRENPENGVLVQDYEGDDETHDHTLHRLSMILEELGKSNLTVPEYLAQCWLVKKQPVECSDTLTLPLYFVSSKRPKRHAGHKKRETVGGETVGKKREREDDASSDSIDAVPVEEENSSSDVDGDLVEAKVVKINRDKAKVGDKPSAASAKAQQKVTKSKKAILSVPVKPSGKLTTEPPLFDQQ